MWNPERLVEVASKEVHFGSMETWGRNWGPRVRTYQAITGAFHAPWCVSFAQWCLKQVGAGPVCDRTAGVFYFANKARKLGWTRTSPLVGDIVCFLHGTGHMGIVTSVRHDGGFNTVEGNASNTVGKHAYTAVSAGSHVFVRIPGAHIPKLTTQWLPRFEIVSSQNGKAKVVVPWGKWTVVGPRVPAVLARLRAAQVRRKLFPVKKWV